MKKLNLITFIAAYLVVACAPQVTSTSEVTVTLTPISTPTLHPEFAALQQTIADSGSRFTLGADGLLYDGETPIPGMTVAPDGTMTLTVNGETVTLDPADVDFDDEKGITIDGYEWDTEAGAWVEAESPAMQQTNTLLDQYHIDPETVTVTEEGGAVNVTDNETGTVLIRTIGENSKFDLGFAVDTIAKNSCEPTDFKPSSSGLMRAESGEVFMKDYLPKLLEDLKFKITPSASGSAGMPVLIDREKKCWGYTTNDTLLFRDEDEVAHKLPLLPLTEKELWDFLTNR
ncbi:MAG: hypothetical protein HYZ24_10330 [Chloroflexi bacterium]|nr:hypothetical protein [Chloroflexota bacterium]